MPTQSLRRQHRPPHPAVLAERPRWKRLMPIVFVTYSFAYLDRSNFSSPPPAA